MAPTSTEFAAGGAGLLIAGSGLLFALFWSLFNGTAPIVMMLVYAPVAIALVSVGVFWLAKGQQLYSQASPVEAGPVPRT
jgi:hypothetical protein